MQSPGPNTEAGPISLQAYCRFQLYFEDAVGPGCVAVHIVVS
mgnify:CR=1 FL=1